MNGFLRRFLASHLDGQFPERSLPQVLGYLFDGEPVASGLATKGPEIFRDQRDPASRSKAQGYEPGESPDELKKLIGELTVQNEIL